MEYYSAWLEYICLVEDDQPQQKRTFDQCIVIVRARSYPQAFKKVLKLGLSQETGEYENYQGMKVRWVLVEVVKLQRIGRTVDGKEVCSLLDVRRPRKPLAFRKQFHPERSKPILM